MVNKQNLFAQILQKLFEIELVIHRIGLLCKYFELNAMADRTLKWFVHHDCRRLYSSTAGGAWRQVLCQSADTRQKNVFNRIASPRKESDWLWHVIDAKVRAWIRFILSIHTPPNHPSTSNTKHVPTHAPHHLPLLNRSCLKGQV